MSEISPVETKSIDLFSKVKSYLTSKKGLYLIIGLLILGAIYYYKTSNKSKKEPNVAETTNQDNIPLPQQQYQHQPPPGYVTVPVEMLQGLQNEQLYSEVPNEPVDAVYDNTPPQLKHNNSNKIDDDSEEEEIKSQNLTKNDMDSIQAQLNAMQQARHV